MNMSEEEQNEKHMEWKQKMENMSGEDKKAMRLRKMQWWASLSDEERAAKKAEMMEMKNMGGKKTDAEKEEMKKKIMEKFGKMKTDMTKEPEVEEKTSNWRSRFGRSRN